MTDAIILAAQSIFLDPVTLGLIALGTFSGLIAGSIPGFTIAMGVILVLPFTFGLSPIQGVATMIGVFVGGLSGGLLSGMLIGIPGTPSSVATTFDGFPMVRSGRAGFALALGLWSSFFGGIISAILLVTLAPQLAFLGLEFGPWDYFMLIVFALTIAVSLSSQNMLKGLTAGILGLIAATVGEDEINGVARFSFDTEALRQGFAFLPVLIGLFAFSQLLSDVEDRTKAKSSMMNAEGESVRIEHLRAIREIFSRWINLVRSSLIGVFVGILPAAGGSISNILAYDQAQKASKVPEQFGKGVSDGIIAPEAANNATAGGALMMMMALGIPGDIVTAVMIGALMIHDIVPGPTFIQDKPVLAYGVFIAFFFANFVMVFMMSGALRVFLKVARVRLNILVAVILAYCAFGVFALHNIGFDLWVLFGFGIVGYIMKKLGFPLAPMILGVVLGKLAEINLSRALAISDDIMLFVSRPWSLFFFLLAIVSVIFPFFQQARDESLLKRFFVPLSLVVLALPLFAMDSYTRMSVGILMIVFAAWQLRKKSFVPQNG